MMSCCWPGCADRATYWSVLLEQRVCQEHGRRCVDRYWILAAEAAGATEEE